MTFTAVDLNGLYGVRLLVLEVIEASGLRTSVDSFDGSVTIDEDGELFLTDSINVRSGRVVAVEDGLRLEDSLVSTLVGAPEVETDRQRLIDAVDALSEWPGVITVARTERTLTLGVGVASLVCAIGAVTGPDRHHQS